MKKLWEYEKRYPDSIEEFRRFPIWLDGDDDDFCVPVEITDPLIYDDEDVEIVHAMFVCCTVRLRDNTRLEGIVYLGGLDMPGHFFSYHLELWYEGELLSVSPLRLQGERKFQEELAQQLGRPFDNISPLIWETPYRIRWNSDRGQNGISAERLLSGQIDLLAWYRHLHSLYRKDA